MSISVMRSAGNTGNSHGVRTQNSVGANTESTWLVLIASTATRGNFIDLLVYDDSGDTRHALDISIGSAGNEAAGIIVPNLFVPATDRMVRFSIPVEIPAGSQVSLRSQSHQGTRPIYVDCSVILDDRFAKGTMPTSYITYNVTADGTATALTGGLVTASATPNTKGADASYVAAIPAGTTHMIIGGSPPSTFNAAYLMDVRVSSDAFATGTTLYGNLSAYSNNAIQPLTLPLEGQDGKALGFRLQSSTASATRSFGLHLGVGAAAGVDGTIVHQDGEMQRLIKGSGNGRVFFDIYAEDGKTPWAGTLTSKKINYKLNGSGSQLTSTADIQRVATGGSAHFVDFDLTERGAMAVDDVVALYIAPVAGQHIAVNAKALVFEVPFTAAPPAVVDSNIKKINNTTIVGDGSATLFNV